MRSHAAGATPEALAYKGIDSYNAATVTERETLPYEHVLQEWETTRAILLQLLEDLPEEKMHATFVFPWGDIGDVPALLRIFIDHELEHALEIDRILGAG